MYSMSLSLLHGVLFLFTLVYTQFEQIKIISIRKRYNVNIGIVLQKRFCQICPNISMGKVLQGKYEENVKSVENIIIIVKYFLILTLIPFHWKGIIVSFTQYICTLLDIYTLFSKLIFNFVFFNFSYGNNAKTQLKTKTYLQCMNTRVVPNQSIQFILKILLFSPSHTTRGK